MSREELRRWIAFLETDISAQTPDEECARVSRLLQLRELYGPEDDELRFHITTQQRRVDEAILHGEYS